MQNFYIHLLDIKSPVILDVQADTLHIRDRLRILYPDGRCEFIFLEASPDSYFLSSCFINSAVKNLKDTLEKMQVFDKKCGLSIKKIKVIL